MKILTSVCFLCFFASADAQLTVLKANFAQPPDRYKPGVYWYFMDGNMSAETMTKDLESMKQAGIGNLIFLEVNIGVPRGPVEFMSAPWIALFLHAEKEARRLGIEITLGIGPGWTGSGGPWITGGQSMQQLVSGTVTVAAGDKNKNAIKKNSIIDLTDKMLPDGTLNWLPPSGKWTIMRFVSRNNGAITRPAP